MFSICIFLKAEDYEWELTLYLGKNTFIIHPSLYSHEMHIKFWAENPTTWETAIDRKITI